MQDGGPKANTSTVRAHAMAKSNAKSKVLAAAEEAEKVAAEYRETPEKKRARMEELEERGRLFGD